MQLKNSVLTKIKKNKELLRALEDLHERSPHRILQWIRFNYPTLCHIDSLKLIAAYLKEDIDGLLEKTEADFSNV